MAKRKVETAATLAAAAVAPPRMLDACPEPEQILYGTAEPPPFPAGNIFPIEWDVETPKLVEIYDQARDPGWAPDRLPWDGLDPASFTADQRYAIAYWFTLLSVFDSSGPAVFARAMIHTYETHEEDPIRKCFFSVTRDEVNHEEICQRAITTLVPGGPLRHVPTTPLGELALNNARWYYHNGARYWEGFKGAIGKYPLAILFTSFLMGELAAATLFHDMHRRTTIPVFREAFRCVGKDEARHLAICMAVLRKVLPLADAATKATITKQVRAGYVFLSGILYEPPAQFWELPETFRPAHALLEEAARGAGLGLLTRDERRENWRAAVLRMKGILAGYDIAFPAIPEIGIDGQTVAFDPADIIPVF